MAKFRKSGHPVSPEVSKEAPSSKPSGARPGAMTSSASYRYHASPPTARAYLCPETARWSIAIAPGEVKALVSGSKIDRVLVKVTPVPKARRRFICQDCAGVIDTLVELLQGRFFQRRHGTYLPTDGRHHSHTG
jgi:hypothetical protein